MLTVTTIVTVTSLIVEVTPFKFADDESFRHLRLQPAKSLGFLFSLNILLLSGILYAAKRRQWLRGRRTWHTRLVRHDYTNTLNLPLNPGLWTKSWYSTSSTTRVLPPNITLTLVTMSPPFKEFEANFNWSTGLGRVLGVLGHSTSCQWFHCYSLLSESSGWKFTDSESDSGSSSNDGLWTQCGRVMVRLHWHRLWCLRAYVNTNAL